MKRILIILSAVLISFSCDEKSLENTYNKQESSIESFIQGQYGDYPVHRRNGSNRITVDTVGYEMIDSLGLADTLEFGDSLYFYYAGFVFTTRPAGLFATNNEQVAVQSKLVLDSADYSVAKILYTPGCLVEGLTNGLYGVKDKEHCIVVFSGKYGFGNQVVANVPKNSALAYEIWVEDIIKN